MERTALAGRTSTCEFEHPAPAWLCWSVLGSKRRGKVLALTICRATAAVWAKRYWGLVNQFKNLILAIPNVAGVGLSMPTTDVHLNWALGSSCVVSIHVQLLSESGATTAAPLCLQP